MERPPAGRERACSDETQILRSQKDERHDRHDVCHLLPRLPSRQRTVMEDTEGDESTRCREPGNMHSSKERPALAFCQKGRRHEEVFKP